MRSFGQLEARLMDVVWAAQGPVTVRMIVDALEEEHPVAYTTVITVLERLRTKGWLSRSRSGKSFQYTASCGRDEYVARLMNDALDDSTDRSATLLSFAGSLDAAEAETLRRALAELDDE